MTVEEAAKALEVSPALVYRLCRANKLGHIRIGLCRGVVRISEDDIERFRRDHRAEVTTEDQGAKDSRPKVRTATGGRPTIPDGFAELKRVREREKAERRGVTEGGKRG